MAAMTVGTGRTVVATANVLRSLGRREAREALELVLRHDPDLVGLQEWGLSRTGLLRETGEVDVRLTRRLATTRPATGSSAPYRWVSSWGDCPVGLRTDRYDVLECSTRVLGWLGPADRGARPLSVVPPRVATVAVLRDRERDRVVSLVNYHLVPGVQARGRYREDRPLLAARHREEVRRLAQLVGEELARGREVHAVGDSNFDGLRLPGLTSAWEGREDEPGTLGARRHVDDVHGPGPAGSVTLVSTASDHKAVLVERADLP
jgi:hypothetical protein